MGSWKKSKIHWVLFIWFYSWILKAYTLQPYSNTPSSKCIYSICLQWFFFLFSQSTIRIHISIGDNFFLLWTFAWQSVETVIAIMHACLSNLTIWFGFDDDSKHFMDFLEKSICNLSIEIERNDNNKLSTFSVILIEQV